MGRKSNTYLGGLRSLDFEGVSFLDPELSHNGRRSLHVSWGLTGCHALRSDFHSRVDLVVNGNRLVMINDLTHRSMGENVAQPIVKVVYNTLQDLLDRKREGKNSAFRHIGARCSRTDSITRSKSRSSTGLEARTNRAAMHSESLARRVLEVGAFSRTDAASSTSWNRKTQEFRQQTSLVPRLHPAD